MACREGGECWTKKGVTASGTGRDDAWRTRPEADLVTGQVLVRSDLAE